MLFNATTLQVTDGAIYAGTAGMPTSNVLQSSQAAKLSGFVLVVSDRVKLVWQENDDVELCFLLVRQHHLAAPLAISLLQTVEQSLD